MKLLYVISVAVFLFASAFILFGDDQNIFFRHLPANEDPVKHFKKAVDRNRVKRLVRETYRLQKPVLSAKPRNGELDIFIIYNDRELPEYQDLYEKMGLLLKKLELSLP